VKYRFWIHLILGILLHFAISFGIGVFLASYKQRDEALKLHQEFIKIMRKSSPENIGREFTERLFRKLRGKSPADAVIEPIIKREIAGFHFEGLQIYLFDREENLLKAVPGVSPEYEMIYRIIETKSLRKFGIKSPKWRVRRLWEKPRLFAIWRADALEQTGKIAGVMVVFDIYRLSKKPFFMRQIPRIREKGIRIGFLNRLNFNSRRISLGHSPEELKRLLRKNFHTSENFVRCDDNLWVMVPVRSKWMLVGIVPKPKPACPIWALGLLFFWLPPVLEKGSRKRASISLVNFLGISLGISAGIPLLFTVIFWFFFEKNRVASISADILQSMEQKLIEIDNSFFRVLRSREIFLKKLMSEISSCSENISLVLPRLNEVELKTQAEIFFLVDAQGNNLRDYSNLDPSLRQFSMLSRAERRYRLQRIIDEGVIFPKSMIEAAMNIDTSASSAPILWYFKNSEENSKKIKMGIGAAGKVIIRHFNQERAKVGGDDNAANLVTDAMVDSSTGDLMRIILSSLGLPVNFGSGNYTCWIFTEVIKDMAGIGKYCALIYLDLRTFEIQFLDEFFRKIRNAPDEDRFFAESSVNHSIFPRKPGKRKFRNYENLLVPPRKLLSETRTLGGKKVLVSALACRNLKNYILIMVKPWESVREGEKQLLLQMFGISLIMGIVIFWILVRLYLGVVLPARALIEGIKAMERKAFDYRIPLTTGDEWDEVAKAFNSTLVSMEELELAKVVHTKLIPSEPVKTTTCTFLGKNVNTGQVGGDYFDAICDADGSLSFIMGDVTGHGVSAALVVGMAKAAFRNLLKSGVRSPAEILNRMNRLFFEHLGKKKLMTAQAGWVTPEGKLIFSNAGHMYPFILSKKSGAVEVSQAGLPLGSSTKRLYSAKEIQLSSPSSLVLFTDGIVEQVNEKGERLGIEGLKGIIDGLLEASPDVLIKSIYDSLQRFSGPRTWDDDVTVAVLRFSSLSTFDLERGNGHDKTANILS